MSDAAAYWEKHRETIRGMFHPVSKALIDEAGIAPGHTVLDVATGSGEPALSIAEVVGSAGLVVGIDPFAAMIAAAERSASERRFKNTHFQIGSAESLPFRDESFDAVVSRFGVMFFSSPVECARDLMRVLKPNRPIALAVWGYLERNPFHYVMARVVDRFFPPKPLAPDSPGPFRYAESGKLVRVLKEAGVQHVSERLLEFNIEIPFSGDEFWSLRLDMAEKLRANIASLSPEKAAHVKQEVLEGAAAYSKANGLSFPGEALIVSAIKLTS